MKDENGEQENSDKTNNIDRLSYISVTSND